MGWTLCMRKVKRIENQRQRTCLSTVNSYPIQIVLKDVATFYCSFILLQENRRELRFLIVSMNLSSSLLAIMEKSCSTASATLRIFPMLSFVTSIVLFIPTMIVPTNHNGCVC